VLLGRRRETRTARRPRGGSLGTPRAAALAVVAAGALILSACVGSGAQDAPPGTVRTSIPAAATTVLGDSDAAALALSASAALFAESPLVVIAPVGDPAAQLLAAAASVPLGVPLLLSDDAAPDATTAAPDSTAPAPTPSAAATTPAARKLDAELARLGATRVLLVGDTGFAPNDDAVAVVEAEATPESVESATGLHLDTSVTGSNSGTSTSTSTSTDTGTSTSTSTSTDTGTSTSTSTSTDTGTSTSTSTGADPDGPGAHTEPDDGPVALVATLPTQPEPDPDTGAPAIGAPPERAATLPTALALVDDDPDALAAAATIRAARAGIRVAADPPADLLDDPAIIHQLHDAGAAAETVLLVGPGFAEQPAPDWSVRVARTAAQLPGGGLRLFGSHRFVALYGTPGAPVLGVLGEQDVAGTIARAQQVAAQYDHLSDVPVIPTLEIIATVAAGDAGDDGDFSNERDVATLEPYVTAAESAGMSVVLDLQPGRTDFLTQAKLYQPLLEHPNVGLALDPEWRLGPDQVPLEQIGSVPAAEVNAVADWLAELVDTRSLPPKMLVLHQFRSSMIGDRASLDLAHPELEFLIHVDGQGAQPDKQTTWNALHEGAPAGVAWGWKNFYDEDAPMLTPEQTMTTVSPVPDFVSYQ
jgi:hypothetical protein